jgi:Kef-type K+ transport system membrane component KefB
MHALLGAFVGGGVLPDAVTRAWREPLLSFAQTILLPAFFVLTGLELVVTASAPLFLQVAMVLTAVAVVGKFAMVVLAARFTRLPWPQCLALGSLMQCKGIMELVVAKMLYDAGLIAPQVLSALVVMATVSTFITIPLARRLLPRVQEQPLLKSDIAVFEVH